MDSVFAAREQVPALKDIWHACFPEDGPEEIARFFETLFRPEECLVRCDGGRPVSMVLLLPAVWRAGETELSAQYIYAAGTLPAYRGRGLFGALLREAHDVGRRRGAAISFLRPGEESLFAYYARFGYEPLFRAGVQRLSAAEMEALAAGGDAWTTYDGDYAALREQALAGYPGPHMDWGAHIAGYAADSARRLGGEVFVCRGGRYPACALCEPAGDMLFVRELLDSEGREAGFYRAACARFPQASGGIVRRPAAHGGEAFGMLARLRPLTFPAGTAAPYMGLALD